MADKKLELTDEEQAAVDKYKVSLDSGKDEDNGNGQDENKERNEKRLQKLVSDGNSLREKLTASQAIIDQMKADEAEKVRAAKIDSGDFKSVIGGYKSQVEDLEKQRDAAKLDLLRYKIGISLDLPPAIAEILRGDDHESISIFAEKLKGELPKSAGFSDGRQTNSAPNINKGNKQAEQGRYQPVSSEVL